jgi:hypothetical protein
MAIDFSKLMKKKPPVAGLGPAPGMMAPPAAAPTDLPGMGALMGGAPPAAPKRKAKAPKRKGGKGY